MRRPSLRPRFGLVGAASFSLALSLLIAAPSSGQNTSGETSSLARYVPKDNLVIYLEYDGLDAHSDAWQKTAAYKILNNTPTGAMLEDLFLQLFGKLPNPKLTGPEALALVKHVARSGFVYARGGDLRKGKFDYEVVVFRDAYKNKDVRPIFFRFLGALPAPNTKLQGVVRAEHKVVTGKNAKGETFTSWVEDSKKEDLVFVYPEPESADIILETLDGKRPNAVDHPARADLSKADSDFKPTGLMYLDGSFFQDPKVPPQLGLGEVKKMDFRWGFQADALMSALRISAPGPRKGFLALLDGPTFDKGKLPPLPESVGDFTVLSLDLKTTVDKLVDLVKANKPDAEEPMKQALDFVKAKTKLRLKEDILAHLGPKVAWYVLPAKAVTATAPAAAPNMLGTMMAGMGMDQVPKLAVVFDVDDAKAFGKVLDELMAATNRELKAQAAAKAPGGDAPAAKGARNRAGGPSVEFRLMPGESKMYVMSVPPELSGQFPASLRPAIRVGPKHVVIAVSADVARLALEAKGTWAPPSNLDSAVQGLSTNLKMLSVTDPRDTLPALLAALPAKLQAGVNTAIMLRPKPPGTPPGPGGPGGPGAPPPGGGGPPPGPGGPGGPGANQPPGGPAPLVFQVDAAKLPSADSIKALLFPSLFTVEVDEQEIRFVSRTAFPSFGDPSKSAAIAGMIPSLMGKGEMPPGGPPPPPGGPPPGAGPSLNPGPGGLNPGDQPGRPANRGGGRNLRPD